MHLVDLSGYTFDGKRAVHLLTVMYVQADLWRCESDVYPSGCSKQPWSSSRFFSAVLAADAALFLEVGDVVKVPEDCRAVCCDYQG